MFNFFQADFWGLVELHRFEKIWLNFIKSFPLDLSYYRSFRVEFHLERKKIDAAGVKVLWITESNTDSPLKIIKIKKHYQTMHQDLRRNLSEFLDIAPKQIFIDFQ